MLRALADSPRFDSVTLPNRGRWQLIASFGSIFLLLWLLLGLALLLSTGSNPFLGWANRPSKVLTLLAPIWATLVILLTSIEAWNRLPPEITIGPDSVTGTPPRRLGEPPRPQVVVIRFEFIEKIRLLHPLGPMVVSGYGPFGTHGPESKMLHLTLGNARYLRRKFLEWRERGRRQGSAGAGPSPGPASG